jgi:hypothetical protein
VSYDNVSTQFHETGNVSFTADGDVVGQTFVAPSADRTGGPGLSTDLANQFVFATCGAGKKAAGVAKYDVADGESGGVHGQPGMIVPVLAGAALTAGVEVMADATGKAIPHVPGTATNRALGLVMSGAASGALAQIKLA